MAPKMPQEYFDLRRQQILKAAWECFADKGSRETTIRDIAREMKVSTGVIYNYFKSKEEIIEALHTWSMENKAKLFEDLAKKDSPRKSLEDLFRLSFECCLESDFKKSMRADINVWADALKSMHLIEKFNIQHEYLKNKIAAFIRDGIEKGEFRSCVNPESYAEFVIAVIIGIQVQGALVHDFSVGTNFKNIKTVLFSNNWEHEDRT